MADGQLVSLETVRTTEVVAGREKPFYPGISNNQLYFHGTRNNESLQKILADGLRPPSEAVSSDTLARKISFSDGARYSGGNGFILGIKPEADEIAGSKSIFARSESISQNLDKLSPERNIFYIPGTSTIPRDLFNNARQIVTNYFEAGFNNDRLLGDLSKLVSDMESRLNEDAVVIGSDKLDTKKIAREMVWNELCGVTTKGFDDVEFFSGEISKIRSERNISSRTELADALNKKADYYNFDPTDYLNMTRFIKNIGNIEGLGFEGLTYPIYANVDESEKWLGNLPVENTRSSKSTEKGRLATIRSALRSMINK